MEKLNTEEYNSRFLEIGNDDENDPTGFYEHFPQMLPWIGKDYNSLNHKKILFIGESHYLPEGIDDELYTPDGWYEQDLNNLLDNSTDAYDFTFTVGKVSLKSDVGNWSSRAHSIYREIEKAMRNTVAEKEEYKSCTNMFQYAAYYNYFLRPAYKGESIRKNIKPKDLIIADDAFKEIIGIIKPDCIYFLSKYAWETYCQKNRENPFILNLSHSTKLINVDYSPHPSCSWWNRKHINLNNSGELLTGKEKMLDFLKKNHVFDEK